MKRRGKILGVALVLGLVIAAGPAWAGEMREARDGGPGFWAVLWQRAVCLVNGSCIDPNGLAVDPQEEDGPRSIFAEEGSCIDPNGRPAVGLLACTQVLRPR